MANLYKIGEVAEICNVTIKALRYYEELGLVKPYSVDIYTGYRYYDEANVKEINKILMLKNLNFSLEEIKNINDDTIFFKQVKIQNQIKELNKKLRLISSLKTEKGEIIMNEFVNDEQAIGKWVYEATALSKEKFLQGDFYKDDNAMFQLIYFLPQGKGYWVFESWTKGEILSTKGYTYKYEIIDSKLFLYPYNMQNDSSYVLVFDKKDNNEYTEEEIEIHDNIDLPFKNDEKVIGTWQSIDTVRTMDLHDYKPKVSTEKFFLQKLEFLPNGECTATYNDGNSRPTNWTESYVLSKSSKIASKYEIRDINNEEYLFLEWKSGDYIYAGKISCYYVLQKIK